MRKYAIPSASRIDALCGSSRFAFSSGTVACAVSPSLSRRRPSWKRSYASLIAGSTRPPEQPFRLVEDRGGDDLLRRLLDLALAVSADEHDLVLRRVEADVDAGDVVVDDEVGVLLVEQPPLPLEPCLPVLGAEHDEHLARALALAERPRDVAGRLELERPTVGALRPLRGERERRAVVGDGGGEEGDVRVLERERSGEHRLGGRGRDRLDARRRGDGEVGREQDDLGAAAPGLLGERDAHPARGAVAEEADRVDGLARAARGDEDAHAGEGRRREQLLGARGDLGRLGHPPDAPLALGRLALVRPDERVAGCDHMRGFIAGARSTGPRCASAASVSVLSARPCASFASVLAVHGATTSKSARVRCGYRSSACPRRASAANVAAVTSRSAPGVRSGTTSWPALTSSRVTSQAL